MELNCFNWWQLINVNVHFKVQKHIFLCDTMFNTLSLHKEKILSNCLSHSLKPRKLLTHHRQRSSLNWIPSKEKNVQLNEWVCWQHIVFGTKDIENQWIFNNSSGDVNMCVCTFLGNCNRFEYHRRVWCVLMANVGF